MRRLFVVCKIDQRPQVPIGAAETCSDEGFDLHFCPLGKNKGSHQFANWWQQHALPSMLHCYWFESLSSAPKKSPTAYAVGDFFIGCGFKRAASPLGRQKVSAGHFLASGKIYGLVNAPDWVWLLHCRIPHPPISALRSTFYFAACIPFPPSI